MIYKGLTPDNRERFVINPRMVCTIRETGPMYVYVDPNDPENHEMDNLPCHWVNTLSGCVMVNEAQREELEVLMEELV